MKRLTEDEWRAVLALSEAAADLPQQARRAFLEASSVPPEILEQALLLVSDFAPETEAPDRVGTSVGRFIITEYRGSGGVGDVYKAKDTELDRTVALKFLRPSALQQSGAVDRFIREARTVSALNHANIVTVYEVLRSGEEIAIVMEFIEGTPLRSLCGGPLSARQVSAIGRQIALALDASHQRGIIHRDIKPENAMVRPDGSLKVLDFGLATSLFISRNGDAVVSASHLFAGTWRYMSPEQSHGEPLTTATDIYSLGLVLCELATGRSPVSDSPTLRSSDSIGLPASPSSCPFGKLPYQFRRLLRSMLSQAPAERPSAAAVSERLADIERSLSRRPGLSLALAAALATLIGLCGFLYFVLRPEASGTLLATAISVEPGDKFALDFSPNGDRIAYAWDREGMPRQIYVQSINEHTGTASPATRLTQASSAEDLPAWSPDSKQIAFTRQRTAALWDIVLRDVLTGRERVLTQFAGRSLVWTRDGRWLLAAGGVYLNHSIVVISPETGEQHPLTVNSVALNDDRPSSTPDNRSVIFARFFSDSVSRLATVPLQLSAVPAKPSFLSWPDFRARLMRSPVYSKDGRDLFFVAQVDNLNRVYRSRSGRTPVLLASLGERIDELAIAARRNRLAFSRNLDDTNIWKMQLKAARGSAAGRITRIIESSRMDQRPAVSPDGSQIAFESNRSGYTEIWLSDLTTGSASQLVSFKSLSGSPTWSPDGRWVAFDSRADNSSSLFRIEVPGGKPQRLTINSSANLLPAVSPDGRWVYFASNQSGRFKIWRIPSTGGTPTLQTEGDGTAPQLSRDGRFLFYLEKFWVPSQLWRKDLFTGGASPVAAGVEFRGYVVGSNSIYVERKVGRELRLLEMMLDGSHAHVIATMPLSTVGGLSLSPKEDTLYFAQLDSSGEDILLVDDF